MVPDRQGRISDIGEVTLAQPAGEEVAADEQGAPSSRERIGETLEVDNLYVPRTPPAEEAVHQEVVEEAKDGVSEILAGDVSQLGIGDLLVECEAKPLTKTFSRAPEAGRAQQRGRVPEGIEPRDRENTGQPSGRIKIDQPSHILQSDERTFLWPIGRRGPHDHAW
jgi:hypothetical protein